jgi:TonB-dependent SusC/RagA subfamily outer membrane receptor
MKKLLFLILFVSLFTNEATSQSYRIFGKVIDDSTKSVIPFASVAISGLNLGTSTNIDGEFQIRVDSLPVGLIFSHVSYDKKEILVQAPDYITISLTPRKVILKELVINERDRTDFPYRLLTQAYNKAVNKSRDWKYGLAYYRQTSKNAEDFSELYEIFYDTRYSSKGILEWDIQEGRYAMKSDKAVEDYVFNKNFTLLSRLVTTYQPETDKFIMPVSEDVRDYYNLYISELLDFEGRKVAVVNFAPKEEIYTPAMSGRLFIDIDSYDILKLEGQIRNDNLDIIALTNPKGSWKDYILNIDAAYKISEDEILLDYISMSQSFDYYVEERRIRSVETNSFLTYYEYYTPEKFKRLGGRLMRLKKSDRELLDRIGYNKRFWEENPIVKRTPVEDDIISSFEAVNAFGTIYLNDREQIQLEKDELARDPFVQQLLIDLQQTKIARFGEKVYLHLDKPYYACGETIWFNAYLVNIGSLVRTDQSGVLYSDLVSPNGEILMHNRLLLNNGVCEGSLDIPQDLESGYYRIRAYTNWMKNYDSEFFYDNSIEIFNTNDDHYTNYTERTKDIDFDIQFFPEGGNMIHNITGQVAFKAIDQNGKGIEIQGKILNSEGNPVVEFKTRHDGMGSFFINPQINQGYRAIVKYGKREKEFEFPEVLSSGYVMTVNNLKDRNIQVMIKHSPPVENSEVYIIAVSRGIIFHREKVELKRGAAVISVPKSKFPDGIAQLTLFNIQGMPECERLVFMNSYQSIVANVKPENEVIDARQKISLKIQVNDQYGKAVRNTPFSMAVTDAGHLIKKETSETIKSNLLLTSDLNGYISDPGYYLINDDRETKIAADLLMLTHGWRRFTWQQIRDGAIGNVTYFHENGINLSGIALNKSKKPVPNTFLRFVPFNNEFFGLWETTTGQFGKFEMNGLIIPDSIRVVVKSVNERGKDEDALLILDPYDQAIPESGGPAQPSPLFADDEKLNYLDLHANRQKIYEITNVKDQIILKEVIVRDTEIRSDRIHGEPDNVLILDEVMWNSDNIFQVLQGRIPGVMVSGTGMNSSVRIRGVTTFSGSNAPLFLVDGVPLSAPASSFANDSTMVDDSDSFVNAAIMSIAPRDVDRIEVLKNAGAAMYGSRGGNGVIAIYTRRGPRVTNENFMGIADDILYLPGFHSVKEFYSPKYDNPEEDHSKPDIRTTLYWNPSVKTNNLGTAEVEFFNSDKGKIFQVDLQGITDYGDPVFMNAFIGEDIVK